MFTRAKSRLGKRGLAALLDSFAAAPLDDPLLFLYPQWFTSALRQRRSIASIGAFNDIKRSNGNGLPVAGRLPAYLERPSRRRTFSSSTLENAAHNTSSQARAAVKGVSLHSALDGGGTIQSPRAPNSPSASPVSDITAEEKRAALNLINGTEMPKVGRTQQSLKTYEVGKTHTRPLARSLPPERGPSGTRKLPNRDQKKLRRRIFFLKTSGQREHESREAQLTDVKNMLEKLYQDSRGWVEKSEKRVELLLPEETIVLLAGFSETALKENIWYLSVHNGCRVHLLDPSESEGPYRKVVLSGSPKVVELVARRIESIQQRQASGDPLVDVRKPPVPMYPSIERAWRKKLPVPLIRGVWDAYMVLRPKSLESVLASRDSLASVREFNEFVEDLTTSRPSHRLSYEARRRHCEHVAEALGELFGDETKSKLFSSAALNQALAFLYEHEFRSTARMVLLKADHVATTVTFNILLSGAARWLDVASFRSLLVTMRRLRIRPNEWTWLAFLDCHVTNEGKVNLARYLLQREYLTADSMRDTLNLTVQGLFSAHLESGRDVGSFFNLMIDADATNWFSISILNQLCTVIAKRRDHSALDQLLTICEEQNLPVDSSIIYHAIQTCRKSIFDALSYALRIMERGSGAARLDSDTFERLFRMAYKGQRMNICRVLWRYACMYGLVTNKMKEIVFDSLRCSTAPDWGTRISKKFEICAGKAIVGLGSTKGIKHPVFRDLPDEFLLNPLLYLISSVKRGRTTEAHLRWHVAKALVSRDMKVGRKYQPLLPLPLMLYAAMLVDHEWDFNPRPIAWYLQNAVRVPVEMSERPMSKSYELE